MTIDKLPLLQKESAGLHWVFVPRSQEAGIVPWRSFISGCPGYWKSILSSSAALSSSATFVFTCTVRHVKAQLVIPGFASVTWGKARWEKYIYCKAFTWNGSHAPWFWIVWHLARSLQRVFRLREQKPALGLRGTLLVAGLGVLVLYVATPGSDVSIAWETEDTAWCVQRTPRGGLEISSKQLLDSEQNFRKLVCWVSWWDEAVGMGGGWGTEPCSSCCQGVLGSNKWISPSYLATAGTSLEESVLLSSPLITQLRRPWQVEGRCPAWREASLESRLLLSQVLVTSAPASSGPEVSSEFCFHSRQICFSASLNIKARQCEFIWIINRSSLYLYCGFTIVDLSLFLKVLFPFSLLPLLLEGSVFI